MSSRVLLASASPRRHTILRQLSIPFEVSVADISEEVPEGEPPSDTVRRLATEKVEAVQSREEAAHYEYILGADTVVVLEETVMGKPESRETAATYLRALSGRTHQVHTAIALYVRSRACYDIAESITAVHMAAISGEELAWYLDTQEWRGVAGGYRIQGRGQLFIEGVTGSPSNVIGLPIRPLYSILTRNRYRFDYAR